MNCSVEIILQLVYFFRKRYLKNSVFQQGLQEYSGNKRMNCACSIKDWRYASDPLTLHFEEDFRFCNIEIREKQ